MANTPKETPRIAGTSPVSAFPVVEGDDETQMTGKQAVILRDLALRAGAPFDGFLTRAEAGERIDALRAQIAEGGR